MKEWCPECGRLGEVEIFKVDDFTVGFLCLLCHAVKEELFPVRKSMKGSVRE